MSKADEIVSLLKDKEHSLGETVRKQNLKTKKLFYSKKRESSFYWCDRVVNISTPIKILWICMVGLLCAVLFYKLHTGESQNPKHSKSKSLLDRIPEELKGLLTPESIVEKEKGEDWEDGSAKTESKSKVEKPDTNEWKEVNILTKSKYVGARKESGKRRFENFLVSYQEFPAETCSSGVTLRSSVGNKKKQRCFNIYEDFEVSLSQYASDYDAEWCIAISHINLQLRVEVIFSKFNLEVGFDRLWIYADSQQPDVVFTGTKQPDRAASSIVVQPNSARHLCVAFSSDNSISGDLAFTLTTRHDIGTWDTESCKLNKAWGNHEYTAECGIGVQNSNEICPATGADDKNVVCGGFSSRSYCFTKKLCGRDKSPFNESDLNLPDSDRDHENQPINHRYLLRGWGLIDADDPNLFKIRYARNNKINFEEVLNKLKAARDSLPNYFSDLLGVNGKRILELSLAKHNGLPNSQKRLGGKLLRSLFLGDRFVAGFTGSSNTAGHQNIFEATYPMQLQAIMRPLWADIGYQGAAFTVRNHAHGGHINSIDEGYMVPQMVGEDADVVIWESIMNDGGRPNLDRGFELHIRNSLRIAKSPVYHMVVAGECKGGSEISPDHSFLEAFTNYAKYGLMFFKPCNGAKEIEDRLDEYKPHNHKILWISWHPGPQGHRLFATIFAYTYLGSVIKVIEDNLDQLKDMAPNGVPTDALAIFIHSLDDHPKNLPHAVSMQLPFPEVTSAITLIEPVMPENILDNYIVDSGGWERSKPGDTDIGDYGKTSFCRKEGGHKPCDSKGRWVGEAGNQPFIVKAYAPTKYIMITHPYFSNRLEKSLASQNSWWHVMVDGNEQKCIGDKVYLTKKMTLGENHGKNPEVDGGCVVATGKGKHVIEIHTDRLPKDRKIYIDTIIGL